MDPVNVRALFYYFTESPEDASTKPLVLWLNRGISHFTLVGVEVLKHEKFYIDRLSPFRRGGSTV